MLWRKPLGDVGETWFEGFGRLALPAAALVLGMAQQARAQAMPELAVSLQGRARSISGLGTEHLALLEVEFSPPGAPAVSGNRVSYTDTDPDLEAAPNSDVPMDPLERDELLPEDDSGRAGRRGHAGPTKKQAIFASIPYVLTPKYVRQAIDAALAAQGVASALARLDSLSTRAKTSAILPDLRLRVGRDSDQSLRLTPTTDDPYRYSQSGGVSFVVEGAVTWRLGRFIFAGEELSIERLRLAQARERRRVAAVATSELLAWQTAWRRAQAEPGQPSQAAAEDLAESTVRLDVLTDGWFSAHQPGAEPVAATGASEPAAPHAAGTTTGSPAIPTPQLPQFHPGRKKGPPQTARGNSDATGAEGPFADLRLEPTSLSR